MKLYGIIFALLFLCINLFAQTVITTTFEKAYVDNLNNIYTIYNNTIKKYNSKGNLLAGISIKSFNTIDYMDISNPFKILAFNQDFNNYFILDNQLNQLKCISIDDYQILEATILCSAQNGGLWIYDNNDRQLKYYDNNKQEKYKTIVFDRFVEGPIVLYKLIEKNSFIFAGIKEYGILIFDQYGNFSKTIHQKTITSFSITGENIQYFENNYLYNYNYKIHHIDSVQIPEITNKTDVILKSNRLFIFEKNKISINEYNYPDRN